MSYQETYQQWCTSATFDEATQLELKAISNDEVEIKDRFHKALAFGTGGLRGVMGAGTNRMNQYTVQKASQGIANVVLRENGQEMGIVIAYDSRNKSAEFALHTACCLVANGIKTYLFESLRPTPELSFAVRYLGCMAGVVITASHNPPEYNGYKVYWKDGAQITFPKDKEIINEVNRITDYKEQKTISPVAAFQSGLLLKIGKEIDDAYLSEMKRLVLNLDAIKTNGKDLKIVYTPLHGTGHVLVGRLLLELGFTQVYEVEEQAMPDGNFPTVASPNPEDPTAFELALTLAHQVHADIVLATDPDADRLGVYAWNLETSTYQRFTGNTCGSLLCEYELSQKKEKGLLSPNSAIIKTIVTTKLANAIAKNYDVSCIETLTGFKYVGEQIHLFEKTHQHTFEFGLEESYGCLTGTYTRDKDAIIAVMRLCEAAAYYKQQGITLWEQMNRIYQTYGYYKEDLATKTLKGIDGATQIHAMMEDFRTNIPTEIAGFKVLRVSDFASGNTRYNLPKSNVLYYELEENTWFCVRPSGTEPKIKFYFGVKGTDFENAVVKLEDLKLAVVNSK